MRDMKDSGVAWLGDIDSRFDIKAIGNLFTIKKEIIGREPDQVLSITQKGIKIKDTTSNEGQNAASYAHYQIVNVGDFAMNHMDLLTGWVDISRYEGVTSPDYRVFTLTDNTQIPEYFLRVFQMYYFNRVFYAFGQGAANLGRWRLPRENFVKISIPCPPVELQRKIVDEIASKVSKVDALIANQQAQIEKLKQYKQALITEVVTKGLDPNAPMKDSGVECIGKIPTRWRIGKIHSFVEFFNGDRTSRYPKPEELLSEGIPFFNSTNINGDSLDLTQCKYISLEKYNTLSGAKIDINDILYCLRGSIGKCAINLTERAGTVASSLMTIRCSESLNPHFLLYVLLSDVISPQVFLSMNGTCAANLSAESVGNFIIPIPEAREMEAIVISLRSSCSKIDELIEIKQEKSAKLTEYKKSIIYEYLTGKIEV